jgi:signal transduction histidine kinase
MKWAGMSMLATISHDLRTPLTRIRLRGEFIEHREQQTRLFRESGRCTSSGRSRIARQSSPLGHVSPTRQNLCASR